MTKSVFAYVMIYSALLMLAGCGSGVDRPSTAQVEGTVTFDNQPLEGASISFIPQDGRPASGFTDAGGHFVLKTFEPGDGAILGEHTVIVTKVAADSNSGDDIYAKQKSVIPEKYGDLKKSGLTATVKPDGGNKFSFELKK